MTSRHISQHTEQGLHGRGTIAILVGTCCVVWVEVCVLTRCRGKSRVSLWFPEDTRIGVMLRMPKGRTRVARPRSATAAQSVALSLDFFY